MRKIFPRSAKFAASPKMDFYATPSWPLRINEEGVTGSCRVGVSGGAADLRPEQLKWQGKELERAHRTARLGNGDVRGGFHPQEIAAVRMTQNLGTFHVMGGVQGHTFKCPREQVLG